MAARSSRNKARVAGADGAAGAATGAGCRDIGCALLGTAATYALALAGGTPSTAPTALLDRDITSR
jgi:hypothetical protein